jgi:hypothetical protein
MKNLRVVAVVCAAVMAACGRGGEDPSIDVADVADGADASTPEAGASPAGDAAASSGPRDGAAGDGAADGAASSVDALRPAVDVAPPVTLSLSRGGEGAGRVAIALAGAVDAGATDVVAPCDLATEAPCRRMVPAGSVVTLTPTPAAGSRFAGWTDPRCPGEGPCTLTLAGPGDASVEARFAPTHQAIEIARTGAGTGAIASEPVGLACGASCAHPFAIGAEVTLTATPDAASSVFAGWGGACSGQAPVCRVTVDRALRVEAAFALRSHELAVSTGGTGAGQVASAPAGIACGATCAAPFPHGTRVTLTPMPEAAARFAGWTGGGCAGLGPCTIDITAATAVKARFFRPTFLSATDKGDVQLAPDRLGVVILSLTSEGVRSERAIAPGSGVFYFEGRRQVVSRNLYFGVATAAAMRDGTPSQTDQALAADSGGAVRYAGNVVGSFDEASTDFGFVVDYRGARPVVSVVALSGGAPRIVSTTELAVTTPLHAYVGGLRAAPEVQQTVNLGNDVVNVPFAYDPAALLRAAGNAAAADALVLGLGDSYAGAPSQPPALTVNAAATSVPLGATVTLTGSAVDPEEGDLTARLRWEDLASPHLGGRVRGEGGSFSFVADALGVHEIRASVTDGAGKTTTKAIPITVTGAVPIVAQVRLEPHPRMGTGVVLSPDGLGARFTAAQKSAVRANQGLMGGFQYFEISRQIEPAGAGGGVVIAGGNLDPYGTPDIPPSASINVQGSVWYNLAHQRAFAPEATHYGFAVDYRGPFPIVHVVVSGAIVETIRMTDVTVPIYPMLYGNQTRPLTATGPDLTINFGTAPFQYDPVPLLAAKGVDVSGFQRGWGPHRR